MLELCATLYIAILDRRGEIPIDVFDCFCKIIKFSDDLIQIYPNIENAGNLEWLHTPIVTLFRGSVYRPYARDFSDLRSLYFEIRSNAFRKVFSHFCKLLDRPTPPAFS